MISPRISTKDILLANRHDVYMYTHIYIMPVCYIYVTYMIYRYIYMYHIYDICVYTYIFFASTHKVITIIITLPIIINIINYFPTVL